MKTVGNGKLKIARVSSAQELAKKAFEMFINSAERSIQTKGKFNVAVSGGQTPAGFFRLLGENANHIGIDWKRVEVFWVDERCVPPEADASNYHLAASTFLDRIEIPPTNVHRMYGEFCDYAEAVHEYEQALRRVFNLQTGQLPQFDLIVLGMGKNAHIGSIFPNSYALFDTDDLVSTVYLMDGNYSRMTLTPPVICAASSVLVLVSGPEKAQIIKEVFESEPDEIKYPVHTLWHVLDKVTWLVDDAAATLL